MLDKKTVGKNIAAYRRRKELTQKEMAELLNITAQSISKWEQGISMPTLEMLHDAAQILDVSMDSLLSDEVIENRDICYLDTGLDTKKLYSVKDKLNEMITENENLISAHYIDPAVFKLDFEQMDDPVLGMITNVPGSKGRLAREMGYDREICADVTARAVNHMLRFGLMPKILQAHIVCGNKEGEQLLVMGESFRKNCIENGIIFAGMEVACQPVNFRKDEYELSVGLVGAADRKNLITGERVKEGDVLIGIMNEGIDASSYPFIRVMLDRKPELAYSKIDNEHYFIEEILKPNIAFTNAIRDLQKENLIHGACRSENTLFNTDPYKRAVHDGLGVCIDLSKLPLRPLYRYIKELDMVGNNFFPYRFGMGIGLLVIVDCRDSEKAIDIISRYNECCIVGHIEKCECPDKKVRSEGKIKW